MIKEVQEQSADISILDFPDCVRKRKEMYLSNMSHAIFEIVDNGVDEITSGHGSVISVEIKQDYVCVTDNGRGIPVTKHKDPRYAHLTQAEVAYTVLHAGGKFGGEGSYKTATGGLHGVGASVTNALSESLTLEVCSNGSLYRAEFSKGLIVKNMALVGPIPEELGEDFTGTSVTFTLDKEIWKDEDLEINRIAKRLQQIAFLNPGLCINLNIDYTQKDGKHFEIDEIYKYDEGLAAYINKLLNGKKQMTAIIAHNDQIGDVQVSFAVSYSEGYSEEIYSFVNNINTEDGGDHLIGFRNGIARAINRYAVENKILKEGQKYDIGDCLEGSVGIVSVKVFEPKFDGQSKSRIKMPSVRQPVRELVETTFYDFLDANPEEADFILKKAELAQKARQSAQKAREAIRKSKSFSGNPTKFAACQSRNPEECEIWYAEGDSAGGSLKQARDRKTQAVLPIFGKIANVEKMSLDEVLNNVKLLNIVAPLKCGIGEDFDIEKLRYHKLILSADADDDGKHIVTLYITYFYRHYREIIERGHLYISTPPLYKIEKNKKVQYAYSEAEKDKILLDIGSNKVKIQRYKGLGEMNPDQLWDTTMNPETRVLLQVTIDDAELCNEAISICMGEEISPRRKFIFDNAIYADLDL